MTCVVCSHRPARTGAYCSNCNSKLEAGKRRKQSEKPVKYAVYRGNVVGFYHNGNSDSLVAKLLRRNPDRLPKRITLNLDTYIEGLTREQVKKIKRAILTLTSS